MADRVPSPHRMVAKHPSVALALCQLSAGEDAGKFQVVDTTSGALIGSPIECAWIGRSMGGQQLLLLREKIVKEGAQTYSCDVLESLSWPGGTSLWEYEAPEIGVFPPLSLSPDGRFAAYSRGNQDGGGFKILDLARMEEIGDSAHQVGEPVTPPTFSPDGRLLVSCESMLDPFWCDEDGEPQSGPSGRARVGTLIIGLFDEWDYVEVPILRSVPASSSLEEIPVPRDELPTPAFLDEKCAEVTLATGETLVFDLEELRLSPRWTALKERKRQALEAEIEDESSHRRAIARYNDRAAKLSEHLRSEGITCPSCGRRGKDFQFHPGTPEERALFICPAC